MSHDAVIQALAAVAVQAGDRVEVSRAAIEEAADRIAAGEVVHLDEHGGAALTVAFGPPPAYLRDDSPPLARCTGCGRSTWSAAALGTVCGMPQPEGPPCEGTMGPLALARDLL